MPNYTIQMYGGAGYKMGTVTSYLIEDTDTHVKAVYDLYGVEKTVSLPVSINVLSSASAFSWHCGIDGFEGNVVYGGVTVPGYTLMGSMRWTSGKANGLSVDTSGWQISLPSAGPGAGRFVLRDVRRPSPKSFSQAYYTVGIWRQVIPMSPWLRKQVRGSLEYWGYFGLSTNVNKDSTFANPTYIWEWGPNPSTGKTMPETVKACFNGVWYLDGADALLVFANQGYGQFCRLRAFQPVLEQTVQTTMNTFEAACSVRDESNGVLHGTDILWVLTARRELAQLAVGRHA